jgi:hypothetical protein
VSVFTDDVVAAEARYQQPSWQFRTFYTSFPLRTRRLGGNGTQVLSIKSGSGTFYRFGVAPGIVASVAGTTGAGQQLPSSLYLTIVRTR